MTALVFWITVVSAALSIAGVLLSWARPRLRIWPPPRAGSWQAYLSWIFIEITMAGPLLLGVLDWNAWSVPGWARIVAGLALVPSGFGLGIASMRRLTVAASFGLEGRLVTTGPYGYSRNPQYVAFALGYLGYALLCNSLLALITALLLSIEMGLAPLAEEPWLRERFGQDYEDYSRRVSRFLGRRGAL